MEKNIWENVKAIQQHNRMGVLSLMSKDDRNWINWYDLSFSMFDTNYEYNT